MFIKLNKAGKARITVHCGAFVQPLLQLKCNKYYIFWVPVCGPRYTASKAHEPYYIVVCGMSGSAIFFHIIS